MSEPLWHWLSWPGWVWLKSSLPTLTSVKFQGCNIIIPSSYCQSGLVIIETFRVLFRKKSMAMFSAAMYVTLVSSAACIPVNVSDTVLVTGAEREIF